MSFTTKAGLAVVLALSTSSAFASDAARIALIRDRIILSAEVLRVARLAEICAQRDPAWVARVRALVVVRQAEHATRYADEVEGGVASLRWMMLGARLVADAAATAEHDRHGQTGCHLLQASGELVAVDRLLDDASR